jgi:AcrR family transcriptional regulator
MTAEPLTREQIVAAAKEALRRYGPAKMTVLDVAQALGVSHGSVYRHFPTKAALRAAVVEQDNEPIERRLEAIAAEDGPALDRLHRLLLTLSEFKQNFAREDPELFETYCRVATDGPRVASAHVELLIGLLDRVLAEGVAAGDVRPGAAAGGGRALFYATSRFHHPAQRASWADPQIGEDFERVWLLLRDGLAVHRRPDRAAAAVSSAL